MTRIHVLQPHIANKIAAGEVVERPASVIKELVENSVDAGSTSITVEIKGGGIEYIRVTDNGVGIPPEEAETAFIRHATSKISDVSDLEHIETLGFRGEALSSIAAVSRVILKTRTAGNDSGVHLINEGGDTRQCVPCGCPGGTTVEVRDLFYNVPARLKFLKNPRSEAGAIFDYMSRMILANPDISFKVINNGSLVYSSTGDGELKNAVCIVYGGDILRYLKEIKYDDGYIKLFGFAGTPEISRSSRQQQTFYINGRYFRSQKISYAAQSAYDTRIMGGRFPFLVLGVKISFNEVDVNVHPNKMEIRFLREDRVLHAVTSAIRTALGGWSVPNVEWPESKREGRVVSGAFEQTYRDPVKAGNDDLSALKIRVLEQELRVRESDGPQPESEVPVYHIPPAYGRPETSAEFSQTAFTAEPYQICGKIFETYWVIQQGESIFLIDQHAIHERRLYEQLSSGIKADSQLLLVPQIIKLPPSEYDTLMESIERFTELGFEIEEFGSFTVCVRAVPHILGEPQTRLFLLDAISKLMSSGRYLTKDLKREAIIQSACKHAVKAGEFLDKSDIEELLDKFAAEGIPLTCPHGRPVMVRMSKLEVEKLFKRVI
jgi:DNA mismatch repair protein MutL